MEGNFPLDLQARSTNSLSVILLSNSLGHRPSTKDSPMRPSLTRRKVPGPGGLTLRCSLKISYPGRAHNLLIRSLVILSPTTSFCGCGTFTVFPSTFFRSCLVRLSFDVAFLPSCGLEVEWPATERLGIGNPGYLCINPQD